jgi:hypothetical protein
LARAICRLCVSQLTGHLAVTPPTKSYGARATDKDWEYRRRRRQRTAALAKRRDPL